MGRFAFIILLTAALSCAVSATTIRVPSDRPAIRWTQTFGDGISPYDGHTLLQSSDRAFALAGNSRSSSGVFDQKLNRLTANGLLSWTKDYAGPLDDWVNDAAYLPDGGFAICGARDWGTDSSFSISKVDSSGILVWNNRIGLRGQANGVAVLGDSSIVVAGYQKVNGESVGTIVRFSALGDSLWCINIGPVNLPGFRSIILRDFVVATDGSLIAAGVAIDNSNVSEGLVTKVAQNGAVIWLKHYRSLHAATAVCELRDSGIVIGGYDIVQYKADPARAMLIRLNAMGDSVSTRQFDFWGSVTAVASIHDGGLVISADSTYGSYPNDGRSAKIVRMNADLSEGWRASLDGNHQRVNSSNIIETYEGAVAVGGRCEDSNRIDMYAMCFETEFPYVDTALTDSRFLNDHVANPAPVFIWKSIYPTSQHQALCEIAIGTDNEWTFAEMWNPAPFNTADTLVTYAGGPLVDGQTYYLRLRISDGVSWSNWYYTSFRMNTAPTAPVLKSPILDMIAGNIPVLWVGNSSDAESDPLTYEFSGFHDTDCVAGPIINISGVASGIDSTGGQITTPLGENCRYWWTARSFDGYEYSGWLPYANFIVNGTPEPPTAPMLIDPPDSSGLPVFDLKPTLHWTQSFDPDPFDTVHYKMELSLNSAFTLVVPFDAIPTNQFTFADSLLFGTHYWWRVNAIDRTGLSTVSASVKDFWTWQLGDVDHSHNTDIADLSRLIDYMFISLTPITPLKVADFDGDCQVDISDLSWMIDRLYISFAPLGVGCE